MDMLKCLCMCTPFHPHVTCVWGDIPKGLGTRVRTFKPSSEVLQTSGEGTDHFHHVHHAWITISTSWLLTSPTSFVIFGAFWPLNTCILRCLQFMAIWSCVSDVHEIYTIKYSHIYIFSLTFCYFVSDYIISLCCR